MVAKSWGFNCRQERKHSYLCVAHIQVRDTCHGENKAEERKKGERKKNIPGSEISKRKGPGVNHMCHTGGIAGRSTGLEQGGQGEVGRRGGQRGGRPGSYRYSGELDFSSEQEGSHWSCEQAEEQPPPAKEPLAAGSSIHCGGYGKSR